MRTKVLYITSAFIACGAAIIWFNKSYFLGLPNFFAWFMASVTIVFLFVAIVVKNVPAAKRPSANRPRVDKYADRREFPRIRHRLKRRPHLIIEKQDHEVLDISAQGLRFESGAGFEPEQWIRGTLVFSDESKLDINGLVSRRQADTVSLQLITTIPADLLAKENKYHLGLPGETADPDTE
jgi:hypothetical protein